MILEYISTPSHLLHFPNVKCPSRALETIPELSARVRSPLGGSSLSFGGCCSTSATVNLPFMDLSSNSGVVIGAAKAISLPHRGIFETGGFAQ